MEQKHTNDEIDLGLVFKKIGEIWRSFLVWIFNCIQFVLRNWIVLLVLIVVGVGLGYVWEKNSNGQYWATLLVKTNFNSANYVYDAIHQVRSKEKEAWFREKYKFNNEENVIKEIEIEPVVDILALLDATKDENRILEQYLSEADFEDDLLLSEAFINEYPLHRINIELTGDGGNDAITGLVNYLNDNSYYNEVKLLAKDEAIQKIKNHKTSLKGVDAVFFSYKDSILPDVGSQLTVKTNQTTNLHWLLQEKGRIMNEIEDIKTEQLTTDEIVYVINDSTVKYLFKLTDLKQILTPIILVILFILISWFLSFYKRLSSLSKKEN